MSTLAIAMHPFQYNRRILLWVMIALVAILLVTTAVYAMSQGGYDSEKLIGRDGTNNSSLYINTTGTDGAPLEIAMSPIVTVGTASGVFMNGGTHATLNGNLTDLNGFPSALVWFEWGYDTSYGNTTTPQTVVATGAVTDSITHFDPAATVHYRLGGVTDGTYYSGDSSFDVTGTIPAAYRIAQLLPLILISIAILQLLAVAYLGGSMTISAVIGMLIILIAIYGVEPIQAALRGLW